MLALIDDRSYALRRQQRRPVSLPRCLAVRTGPSADLVTHLGQVQLFWAAVVAAGPPTPRRPKTSSAIGSRTATCSPGRPMLRARW